MNFGKKKGEICKRGRFESGCQVGGMVLWDAMTCIFLKVALPKGWRGQNGRA